jgi:hypothetical protein
MSFRLSYLLRAALPRDFGRFRAIRVFRKEAK